MPGSIHGTLRKSLSTRERKGIEKNDFRYVYMHLKLYFLSMIKNFNLGMLWVNSRYPYLNIMLLEFFKGLRVGQTFLFFVNTNAKIKVCFLKYPMVLCQYNYKLYLT